MRYLLDTNILLRIAQRNHPMHRDARECVRMLFRRKDVIQIVPQVLFEFWVVARAREAYDYHVDILANGN